MTGPGDGRAELEARLREPLEALAGLDRRTFLRLAAAVAAVGLAPTGCGDLSRPLAPPPGVALASLTPRSYAVFQAAALRLLGPKPAAIVASGAVDPAGLADAWLARLPELAATLHRGLLVLELAPWPVLPKLRPFTRLDGRSQDWVLRDLMLSASDWKRALFKGVKSFACLTFYASPPSRAVTRYPGPFGSAEVTIADAMRYDDGPGVPRGPDAADAPDGR
jgi:hypothetical protein